MGFIRSQTFRSNLFFATEHWAGTIRASVVAGPKRASGSFPVHFSDDELPSLPASSFPLVDALPLASLLETFPTHSQRCGSLTSDTSKLLENLARECNISDIDEHGAIPGLSAQINWHYLCWVRCGRMPVHDGSGLGAEVAARDFKVSRRDVVLTENTFEDKAACHSGCRVRSHKLALGFQWRKG